MASTRTSRIVLTGAVGLAGIGVGAALAPVVAASATSSTAHVVTDRVSAIKNALSGLVKDGTLTQAQADKVATTLDQQLPEHGPGGPGHGFGPGFEHRFGPGFWPGIGPGPGADLKTVADLLKMTPDELRTALKSGKTLAQVAQSKGVTQAQLVDKLTAAAQQRLDQAVKDGKLTQAQADDIAKNLEQRITDAVTRTRPEHGPEGRHGWTWHHGPGEPASPTSPSTSPSTSPTS